MHLTSLNLLIAALLVVKSTSAAIVLPREPVPKGGGGGGGGGGHAGGGGGGHPAAGGGGHNGSTGSGHSGGSSSGGSSGGHTGSSGSGAGRGGSGDTGHTPISNFGGTRTSGGGGGGGTRSANYFSSGGGSRAVTPPGSVFSGREYGGGDRSEVLGTRGYGSGYPYTSSSIHTTGFGVAGQPFPFGFWPLYWAGHGNSSEYGGNSTVDAQRPGGEQVLVQLVPNITGNWNTTTAINGVNESYWMVGDDQSVMTLLSILIDPHNTSLYGCSVQNTTATITPFNFNTSSDPTPVEFENVIQWYRASSFALAFQGYTNAYALPPLNDTAGLGWNDSTPLPTALEYSPFLQCINSTITAALPILDSDSPDPPTTTDPSTTPDPDFATDLLTPGQIAGIVIGSIAGAVLLGVAVFFLARKAIQDKKNLETERNGLKVTTDDKMETSDTVEKDCSSSSVLAPAAYAEDDKPSTSETPLLSANNTSPS
jgi:hypothetical protein